MGARRGRPGPAEEGGGWPPGEVGLAPRPPSRCRDRTALPGSPGQAWGSRAASLRLMRGRPGLAQCDSRPLGVFPPELFDSPRSDPALHRLCGVCRRGVETYLRAWRLCVDEVNELFEQQQLRRRAKSCSDHHAVKLPRIEMPCGDRFGGVAEIDQATVYLVSQAAQTLQL